MTIVERAAAIGIYEGPLVPVNGEDFLHLVHPGRIVVATGAVERHGVFPGSDLPGVWLSRGAARLAGAHGLALGRRVVFAGEAGETLEALRSTGIDPWLVSEGEPRASGAGAMRSSSLSGSCRGTILFVRGRIRSSRVRATRSSPVARSRRQRRAAVLQRWTVASLGNAAGLRPLAGGFVCLSARTSPFVTSRTRGRRGFGRRSYSSAIRRRRWAPAREPCARPTSVPSCRALGGRRGSRAPTTAARRRRPIRLEDLAAGHAPFEERTALHDRHLELGAEMEWAGTWKRPRTYGDPLAEYWAVRRDVGIMDVGTLGKVLVAGRDATEFLERLYPNRVADLERGKLRYGLLLNEAGYVIDDGTICPLGTAAGISRSRPVERSRPRRGFATGPRRGTTRSGSRT